MCIDRKRGLDPTPCALEQIADLLLDIARRRSRPDLNRGPQQRAVTVVLDEHLGNHKPSAREVTPEVRTVAKLAEGEASEGGEHSGVIANEPRPQLSHRRRYLAESTGSCRTHLPGQPGARESKSRSGLLPECPGAERRGAGGQKGDWIGCEREPLDSGIECRLPDVAGMRHRVIDADARTRSGPLEAEHGVTAAAPRRRRSPHRGAGRVVPDRSPPAATVRRSQPAQNDMVDRAVPSVRRHLRVKGRNLALGDRCIEAAGNERGKRRVQIVELRVEFFSCSERFDEEQPRQEAVPAKACNTSRSAASPR